MKLNCEHSCKSLLHFKNISFVILHLLPNHGIDLWTFLQKFFCVSRFKKKKLHLLPSFGHICGYSCKNFLCFRNFFLCICSHITEQTGEHWVDLWSSLQKLVVVHFCFKALFKSFFKKFFSLWFCRSLWCFTFVVSICHQIIYHDYLYVVKFLTV